MAFLRTQKLEDPTLNLTSLVDIMFILILFLVLTAHYTKIASLKVNLPKAASATAAQEEEFFVVVLKNDGQIFLNDKNISIPELKNAYQELVQKDAAKAPHIVVRADEASQTGLLVRVMDLARQAGLSKIAIEALKTSAK